MENFCTCKNTDCKFNLVTEDKSKIKGYGLNEFAELIIEELK